MQSFHSPYSLGTMHPLIITSLRFERGWPVTEVAKATAGTETQLGEPLPTPLAVGHDHCVTRPPSHSSVVRAHGIFKAISSTLQFHFPAKVCLFPLPLGTILLSGKDLVSHEWKEYSCHKLSRYGFTRMCILEIRKRPKEANVFCINIIILVFWS